MLALSMKSSIIVLAKFLISVLFMTSVKRFSRAAVSFILLAAALFLLSCSAFADYRADSRFVSAQASASLDLASGSAIDGALSALGVKLALGTGALLTTKDLIESVISGTPLGVVDYTYDQPLSTILNQETIKIRKDYVVIDGVEYSDVWLPHDAANKFRVNAFDFITHYNILSESSGTYASGVGNIDGILMYNVDGVIRSQDFVVPGSYIGDVSTSSTSSISGVVSYASNVENSFSWSTSAGFIRRPLLLYKSNTYSWRLYLTSSGDIHYRIYNVTGSSLKTDQAPAVAQSYNSAPFDFTWVSGSIPVDPLPAEEGLRFRVPSAYVSSFPAVVSPDLVDYATVISGLSNALEQARLANAVESTAFEEYDTPVPPVPSTGTIAEEPYSSLDGSLTVIQDSLDNIDTNIGTVDESLDDIQVYAEDAADSLQSIDTNLSQSVADIAGIKGFIQQYLPGVHSLLSSISSSVSDIAGSIAAADQTFFGNVVDSILAPFTPVFDIFKSGVGIWRYVVTWVGNISAPFAWIWNTLSQANGIFVSPILASAAAAVILAVYKRFGR